MSSNLPLAHDWEQRTHGRMTPSYYVQVEMKVEMKVKVKVREEQEEAEREKGSELTFSVSSHTQQPSIG